MNIECVTEKLQTALDRVERVVPKNPQLPVLKCVLISTQKTSLTLRATNLEIGVETNIPAKILDEGEVAVPATLLKQFISSLDNKNNTKTTLSLNKKENTLNIKTKHTSTNIKTINSSDFPTLPKTKGLSLSLPNNVLTGGIRSVMFASAQSTIKPEQSSVYIYLNKNELTFVATDSFRLAEKTFSLPKINNFDGVLIPQRNAVEIARIFETTTEDILITVSDNQTTFSTNNIFITSRTIDGLFPDYKSIIPDSLPTKIKTLKKDFVSALKTTTLFSDVFNKVTFSANPKENTLSFTTKNTDIGESTNSIKASIKGSKCSVNFNHRYVSDSFQVLSTDSISLELDEGKPMVLRGVGDTSFLYLVMSMTK